MTNFVSKFKYTALAAGVGTLLFAAGAQADPITITIRAPGSHPYQDPIQALMPEIHKQFPNVKLVIEPGSGGSKLTAEFAAGSAPDIVIDATRDAPQYVARGLFVPIDFSAIPGLDSANEASFEKLWAPGLAGTLRMMGKFYFLPSEVTSFATYYNKDILAAAGYDLPATTWQGLGDMALKLQQTSADGKVTRYGMVLNHGWVWESFHVISMMRQNGVNWLTDDGKPQFSNPKAIQAVQVYADLYHNGALSNAGQGSAFQNGKAALYPGALYEYFNFVHGNAKNLGTVAYPVIEGGTPTSPSYAYGAYVTSTSKHQHIAWQIAALLYGKDQAPSRFEKYSLLMPWAGSWLAEIYQQTPALKAFFEDLQNAWVEPETPHDSDLNKYLDAARNDIVAGKVSVATAMQQLDQQLTPILSQPLAPMTK